MLFSLVGLLLLASTGSTPAAGGAAPATQADAAGGVPAKKAKKICRTLDADTGSRLGSRKVCKSSEEWSAERDSRPLDRDLKQPER
jgi:hypothetical protein